jgi:hypothetical protein
VVRLDLRVSTSHLYHGVKGEDPLILPAFDISPDFFTSNCQRPPKEKRFADLVHYPGMEIDAAFSHWVRAEEGRLESPPDQMPNGKRTEFEALADTILAHDRRQERRAHLFVNTLFILFILVISWCIPFLSMLITRLGLVLVIV